MSPILCYLQEEKLKLDEGEARRIRKQALMYIIHLGKLYKMGRASPMLRCLGKHEVALVLVEVHKGSYRSHICENSHAQKLLRIGYYWPTLMKDIITFIKKCD